MTMGGPSDLELGGVNHSTNKKTHAILRHIGSQRTFDNMENNCLVSYKTGYIFSRTPTDAQLVNKLQLQLFI
jgi:hypothetical protein